MTTRVPLIAANWKMNTTVPEGVALCQALRERLAGMEGVEIVICPPFTHLVPAGEALRGTRLSLGAQDLYWEPRGAFTGAISATMLRGLVEHVIVGHSERRSLFHESDEQVNRKLNAALAAGLRPILCVGESGEQRRAGATESVLRQQVQAAIAGIELSSAFIVAYEPVWAIGSGQAAHGEQAQQAIAVIRALLRAAAGAAAEGMRILYGGSVTAANIGEFLREPDVDGALVGGASLQAESFAGIVQGAGDEGVG